MVKNKTVIFDFDGTLADTLDLLIDLYNRHIAPVYGTRTIKPENIEALRNRPDTRKMLSEYRISMWKLPKIMLEARKLLKKEISAVRLHPGIENMLVKLHASNISIGILSSNSKEIVQDVLEKNHLAQYVDFIYSNNKIFRKDWNLRQIIKKENIEKGSITYIGDETRDIKAANRTGIQSIAVTWGFQSKQALLAVNPSRIVDHPNQMHDVISTQ